MARFVLGPMRSAWVNNRESWILVYVGMMEDDQRGTERDLLMRKYDIRPSKKGVTEEL